MAYDFQSVGCMQLDNDYVFIICGENGAAKYDLVRATVTADVDGTFPMVAEWFDGSTWRYADVFTPRGRFPAGTNWHAKKEDVAFIRVPVNAMRMRLRVSTGNLSVPVSVVLDGGPEGVYHDFANRPQGPGWNIGSSVFPPPAPATSPNTSTNSEAGYANREG